MQNIPVEKFRIVGLPEDAVEVSSRPHIGYFSDAWRRLRQNKVAVISLVMLVLIVILCIIGPSISGYSFEAIDKTAKNLSPCKEHWFGTDKLGRDIFARIWISGRVSLTVGILGAFISSFIGCLYGGIAAYFGGKVDNIMMRINEVLISVPYLIVVIVLSLVLESKSIGTLILAMTITGWCGMARFVRAQMLSIKSEEYILAAKAIGVSPWKTITRHMIPNTLSAVIVSITFDIPGFIFWVSKKVWGFSKNNWGSNLGAPQKTPK